ncbi:hypothetical protein Tchl_0185 [Thauera chlorobenzoica]|uniref:Uncharacterized protein n=1 Tax=Thauera chlorobenzoica TaxID=96773 RepID=A0A1L6F847_9RHOO|nr:hypothetical protein Tchl_0185 [Thauera chlorobenzoica]
MAAKGRSCTEALGWAQQGPPTMLPATTQADSQKDGLTMILKVAWGSAKHANAPAAMESGTVRAGWFRGRVRGGDACHAGFQERRLGGLSRPSGKGPGTAASCHSDGRTEPVGGST